MVYSAAKQHSNIAATVYLLLMAVLLPILVSACGSAPYGVPVVEKSQGYPVPTEGLRRGYHIVKKGDTLYSIAWSYGFDYKDLAYSNHIRPPYLIKPGQRVYLRRGAPKRSTSSSELVISHKNASNTSTQPQKPAVSSSTAVKSSVKQPVKSASVAPTKTIKKPWSSDSAKWQWPSDGAIIKRFSSANSLNKGIDLSGRLGDAVKSARAGKVVYAGSGLTGYGKLVIVKHDDRYLSAYAHSSRILVAEGQEVKAGQKIAEVGSTGSRQVKLHFEIRDNGKPVDPLKLLPAR